MSFYSCCLYSSIVHCSYFPFRKLKLWHGETARLIGEFYGHNVSLSSVTFSEDGELLASGDKRGNIFIWRTEDFDWLLELESGLTQPISDLQFVYKFVYYYSCLRNVS